MAPYGMWKWTAFPTFRKYILHDDFLIISAHGSFQFVDMGNIVNVSDIHAAQWFIVTVDSFYHADKAVFRRFGHLCFIYADLMAGAYTLWI
jgi:hypothetical protein